MTGRDMQPVGTCSRAKGAARELCERAVLRGQNWVSCTHSQGPIKADARMELPLGGGGVVLTISQRDTHCPGALL